MTLKQESFLLKGLVSTFDQTYLFKLKDNILPNTTMGRWYVADEYVLHTKKSTNVFNWWSHFKSLLPPQTLEVILF